MMHALIKRRALGGGGVAVSAAACLSRQGLGFAPRSRVSKKWFCSIPSQGLSMCLEDSDIWLSPYYHQILLAQFTL